MDVHGVDGIAHFVKAEQLHQIEVHAIGLVDDASQVIKSGGVAPFPALQGNFFQRTHLQVE